MNRIRNLLALSSLCLGISWVGPVYAQRTVAGADADYAAGRHAVAQAANAGRPAAPIVLERADANAVTPDPASDPSVFGPYGC
jgi:hypothetical protein